jgi:hypothetical protein
MRQVPILMGALMIALIGSLGVLWYRPSLWPEVAAKIVASQSQAPPAPGRESPFATPERRSVAGGTPVRPPLLDAPEQPTRAESAPSTPVEYRFPVRADVSVGIAKSDILAALGPAQTTVAGADRGQLRERLIYTRRSTNERTIIDLVNGKVTSADTFAAGGETR